MIHYETTATFNFATSVRPEVGLESEVRRNIKLLIEHEGVDAFLDLLDYGTMTERHYSDEEFDALIESGDIRIPAEGLKQTLTAISLGLVEIEGVSKEEAIETLKKFFGEERTDD